MLYPLSYEGGPEPLLDSDVTPAASARSRRIEEHEPHRQRSVARPAALRTPHRPHPARVQRGSECHGIPSFVGGAFAAQPGERLDHALELGDACPRGRAATGRRSPLGRTWPPPCSWIDVGIRRLESFSSPAERHRPGEANPQAAALTTSVTVEPGTAVAAGSGFCEITNPVGTFESGSDSMLTSRPARFRIATASLRSNGGCETLGTETSPVGVVPVVDVVGGRGRRRRGIGRAGASGAGDGRATIRVPVSFTVRKRDGGNDERDQRNRRRDAAAREEA